MILTGKQEYHRYKQEVTACRLLPLQQLKENNFKVYITNSHLLAFKFFPVFNLDAQHNEMTQGKNKGVLLKQEVDFLVTA